MSVSAVEEKGCDGSTVSLTYYTDPNCRIIDTKLTQQESLKFVSRQKDGVMDGFCHNEHEPIKNLRTRQESRNSMTFSCTDDSYNESWYFGENCSLSALMVKLTAEWGKCVRIGDVSFMATK